MVQASPEAEAICNKSSLGVVDLLRPYSFVDEKFQLTTVGEPYQLKGFALRFVHTSEFTELAADAADAHLQRLLSSYDCAAELAETEKLDLPLPEGPAPSLPPLRSGSTQWITAFREQLAGALRNSEGASLDHPVSCVLVASALQPKVTSVFNALLSHANLTPVIAEGVADPGFARSYILLHDASDPSADMGAAQAALAEASRAFGAAACHLLTLNTREANQPLPADIWTSARPLHHSPPAGSKREAAGGLPGESPLSEGDVTNLQALIEGPLTKQILSSLQSRYVALAASLSLSLRSPRSRSPHPPHLFLPAASSPSPPPSRPRAPACRTSYAHGSAASHTGTAAPPLSPPGAVRALCATCAARSRRRHDSWPIARTCLGIIRRR